MRLFNHLELDTDRLTRIRVTGGASRNGAILQIIADIFGKPVDTFDMPNSACLGAAYMAKYSHDKANATGSRLETLNTRTFKELIETKSASISDPDSDDAQKPVINPRSEPNQIYSSMLERCRILEIQTCDRLLAARVRGLH